MKVILGSSSPRRKEILKHLTGTFEIISPSIEEEQLPGETPEDFIIRISADKSKAVYSSLKLTGRDSLIITSDTIVELNGKILGKPADHESALAMLSELQGREHHVMTSITLTRINDSGITEKTDYETTSVTFKKLTDKDIERYLSLIEYRDKAGSYAVQEYGEIIVESTEGSMSNIIGFPVRLFIRMLNDMGLMHLIS